LLPQNVFVAPVIQIPVALAFAITSEKIVVACSSYAALIFTEHFERGPPVVV
jgi:hypothetical protein